MTEDQAKDLIKKYVKDFWNDRDMKSIKVVGTKDFNFNSPFGALKDEAFITYVQALYAGFPDSYFHVHSIITEGGLGSFRWTWEGTNTKDFFGNPATGKKAMVPGTSTVRFEGDKIAEAWSMWDRLKLVEQTGIPVSIVETKKQATDSA